MMAYQKTSSNISRPRPPRSPSLPRLLGLFLSPWRGKPEQDELKRTLDDGDIPWEKLLFLAGSHLVTPLLTYRMKCDGFAPRLPDELQQFLGHMYDLNRERNHSFLVALASILDMFRGEGIDTILLKGAACFCDDLYGDSGARMLQDLDLLINREQSQSAWDLLVANGWQEIPQPGKAATGLAVDARHHHLNGLHLPGTPVPLELHYKIGYASISDMLPTSLAWRSRQKTSLAGQAASIPDPAFRLLHNAAHALVSDAAFIRGQISLQQLADFVWLAWRYQNEIDWGKWLHSADRHSMGLPFQTYLELAGRLFAMPMPSGIRSSFRARLHANRIETVMHQTTADPDWRSALARGYYLCNLPGWIWKNVCYTGERGHAWDRLHFFIRKLADRGSWRKI